jgi:hypothetical protein
MWQVIGSRSRGGGFVYQLLIEVRTTNGICLRITVGLDPAASATRRALAAAQMAAGGGGSGPLMLPESSQSVLGRGLRVAAEWAGEWAGTFDGPLAPGIFEETFHTLSLADLLRGGGNLCDCVWALDKMLLRRDGPPRLLGAAEPETQAARVVKPAKYRATDELPFPRTCGTCWSPHGDLLCFGSLQGVTVPFPRRWSSTDYQRVLKIHREKEVRTLLREDDDEHIAAASRLRIDSTVRIVPAVALGVLVEDHWWAAAAPLFALEPSPSLPSAVDLCHHNRKAALSLGRTIDGVIKVVWFHPVDEMN